jgi:L-asparaginase
MPKSGFPRIAIIGCGGTIASLGTSSIDVMDYPDEGQKLPVTELIDRVPELASIAEVVAVPYRDISSSAIGIADWLTLRGMIAELCAPGPEAVDGIVIAHGTGTLEETAFFLHLTCDVEQNVVLVGAQRPLNALGSDAPMNLMNAVRVAGYPGLRGQGVLVVLNDEIHSARDVVKTSNYRVQAFRSAEYGALGLLDGDGIHIARSVLGMHTRTSPFAHMALNAVMPRVDILYAYAGGDDLFVRAAMSGGAQGLVSAGFAPGLTPPAVKAALEEAAGRNVPVVLASRASSGRVVERRYVGSHGMIAAGDLSPQKARILLMLCLAAGQNVDEVRRTFRAV